MDNSPFARLPPELRDRIWNLTVTGDGGVIHLNEDKQEHLASTQVCKQINQECHHLYYKNNKFSLVITDGNTTFARRWLSAIPLECLKFLRGKPLTIEFRGNLRCNLKDPSDPYVLLFNLLCDLELYKDLNMGFAQGLSRNDEVRLLALGAVFNASWGLKQCCKTAKHPMLDAALVVLTAYVDADDGDMSDILHVRI